jgi:NAD(P)-dependent dehydrogenase (short-subunit alcohol dehydrogenase family)
MPSPVSPAPPPAALVTGGALRIGRAIALALARSGYAVAIHANRSRTDAEALRDKIVASGGRAGVVAADLADHAAVTRLVPAAVDSVGPLTLLVNNASAFEPDRIGELDRDRFDRQIAVNLRAPVFLSEAFAAQASAGGSIVNVLDQRVYRPSPGFFSYGLSKSALYVATTTLAQGLAPHVRVNAVAPGPTLPNVWHGEDAFAAAAQRCRETIAVDGGQHVGWDKDEED